MNFFTPQSPPYTAETWRQADIDERAKLCTRASSNARLWDATKRLPLLHSEAGSLRLGMGVLVRVSPPWRFSDSLRVVASPACN